MPAKSSKTSTLSKNNVRAAEFRKLILAYFNTHGRHSLPWRKTRDPYKILVSEIMLQQTQVERVIPKYRAFMRKFPTFAKLARASAPAVLQAWQGLGYNRRALYLKRAAERVAEEFGGKLPRSAELLDDLPGIGANTAGAVLAYAFNEPAVFIETNIRRVFIHFFFKNRAKVHDAEILELVAKTLDRKNPRRWYSALMDYGTYLKTQVENPNRKSRHYAVQSPFEGSDRQLRGKILKILLAKKKISPAGLALALKEKKSRIGKILAELAKDGFIEKSGRTIFLKD